MARCNYVSSDLRLTCIFIYKVKRTFNNQSIKNSSSNSDLSFGLIIVSPILYFCVFGFRFSREIHTRLLGSDCHRCGLEFDSCTWAAWVPHADKPARERLAPGHHYPWRLFRVILTGSIPRVHAAIARPSPRGWRNFWAGYVHEIGRKMRVSSEYARAVNNWLWPGKPRLLLPNE